MGFKISAFDIIPLHCSRAGESADEIKRRKKQLAKSRYSEPVLSDLNAVQSIRELLV